MIEPKSESKIRLLPDQEMDLRSVPSFSPLYENSAEDIRHQIRAQQLHSLRRIAEEYKLWKEENKKKSSNSSSSSTTSLQKRPKTTQTNGSKKKK